jgi:hypothetical protein
MKACMLTLIAVCIVATSPALSEVAFGATGGFTDGESASQVPMPSNQIVRVHMFSSPGFCIRLAAAGVVTRNAVPAPPVTGGTITLPPGPTAANIVWAGLYWVILDNAPPVHANGVTLNGFPVVPIALPVTTAPCWWPPDFAHAYFADVTGMVVAGANSVFGLDDSGISGMAPESEGASLVVIYEDEATAACEIIVTDGNDVTVNSGDQWDNALPITCGDGLGASLWFIGGDGQVAFPDNEFWNLVPLGVGNDWDASDPFAPGAFAGGWDTDGWAVVTGPPNTASIDAPIDAWDCVNWVATAIEVGVDECVVSPVEPRTWGTIKGLWR